MHFEVLTFFLQSEYPDYTPLLAKILEALVCRSDVEDRICLLQKVCVSLFSLHMTLIILLHRRIKFLHCSLDLANYHYAVLQVIDAADEIVKSIDREDLAKFLSLKSDPEDEEAEVDICFVK